MFYEQGRRNDYVCEQCPTIMSVLDNDPCVRRSAGLSYLSKMAPGTHVAAHQAGTNIRLRCHLALSIPPGDCAIRVGDEVRHWEEGRCIVFDDTFEHEVWNRTDQERLVLLVDLWHPHLSSLEREGLEAINWISISRAYEMLGTWQRNDAQRKQEQGFAAKGAKDLED
jgi:aspartate beta-hydroxylase